MEAQYGHMTLEFKQGVKALDAPIEVLKQDLFFALVSTKHNLNVWLTKSSQSGKNGIIP
jgi:hypothetical protein